ncbi:hypothetical protein MRX96_043697 [Rhipicephalus microplus]
MHGVNLKGWHTWVVALRNEFDYQLLFCEWVERVNARWQNDDENITDYMYSRLQRIRRGKYALGEDGIVDWLIRGVESDNAKPMLADFQDLRKEGVSDFISYAQQFDRHTTLTHADETRIVDYASKKVPDSDRHKHSTELEAIAVLLAVTDKFHQHFRGCKHFQIYTDNWALAHIMSKKHSQRPFARIVLDLISYNFKIRHTPEKTNAIADLLSRVSENTHNAFVMKAEEDRL